MFKQCFTCLGFVALLSLAAWAQTSTQAATLAPGQPPTWHTEQWTGDERPYVTIRSRVYKDFPDGGNRELLLQRFKKYRAQAQRQPQDPKVQFALGYATYRAIRLHLPITNVWQIMEAIRRVPSPHTYQFARMRYLMEKLPSVFSIDSAYAPSVKKVGERLLQRNPNDYDVKFLQINSLSLRDPKEKQLALKYAQDLIRMRPNVWSAHYALGNVYHSLWFWSNVQSANGKGKQKWIGRLDQANRDKAIARFRKALQLLSPKDENYKLIQRRIARTLKGLPI